MEITMFLEDISVSLKLFQRHASKNKYNIIASNRYQFEFVYLTFK